MNLIYRDIVTVMREHNIIPYLLFYCRMEVKKILFMRDVELDIFNHAESKDGVACTWFTQNASLYLQYSYTSNLRRYFPGEAAITSCDMKKMFNKLSSTKKRSYTWIKKNCLMKKKNISFRMIPSLSPTLYQQQ